MNASEAAASPRDPRAPGAPIIPRDRWDLPPWHRWTFQHIREMTPTAQIWRGPGPALALPESPEDVDGLSFDAPSGRQTVRAFLDGSFTDGFLVLSRGKIVAERYMNGLVPHAQHLAMSVTKSFIGMLAGILVHRGILDPDARLTRWLPELEATGYRDATLQHVLDMTSGVVFDETYGAVGSHMEFLDHASGWKRQDRPDWAQTMWELVLSLREQERPHGTLFSYRSIETDVLGFAIERASGERLADLLARELWAPMGSGEDAYITVDHAGYALADGGLCATLRDYGRFALMLARGGRVADRQVVPAEWIEATRNADHSLFRGSYHEVLPEGGYRNQFWVEDPRRRSMVARGIFGQFIYIDPDSDFAAVKLSTWPEFTSAPRAIETLAAFRAIRDHCERP